MKKIWIIIVLLSMGGCGSLQRLAESELKYNYNENKHEYTSPGSELKYNYNTGEWSYEDPRAKMKYNYYNNKWEWGK